MNAVLLAFVAYVLAHLRSAPGYRGACARPRLHPGGEQAGAGLVIFSISRNLLRCRGHRCLRRRGVRKGARRSAGDPLGYAIAVVVVGLLSAGALWCARRNHDSRTCSGSAHSQAVERLVVFVLLPGSLFGRRRKSVRSADPDANSGMGLQNAIALRRQCWWPRTRSSEGSSPTPSPTPFKASSSWLASSSSKSSSQAMSAASRRWLRGTTPPALYSSIPRFGCSARWRRSRSRSAGPSWRWNHLTLSRRQVRAGRRYGNGGGRRCLSGRGHDPGVSWPCRCAPAAECAGGRADGGEACGGAPARAALHRVCRCDHLGKPVGRALRAACACGAALPQHRGPGDLWAERHGEAVGRTTDRARSQRRSVRSLPHVRRHSRLIENASAFGSAGVFVATLFALFTGFGGPLAALTSIAAGMVVWAGGKFVLGLATPYLLGLCAAPLVGYVAVALIEQRR